MRAMWMFLGVGLLLSVGLGPGCGGGGENPPIEQRIHRAVPGEGIVVQQVDFLYLVSPDYDTRWGRLLIDSEAVGQASGMDEGYVNVVINDGRPLVNVPLNPCALRWIAAYVDLGITEDVQEMDMEITVSSLPVADMREHRGTPIRWDVGTFTWNAEGIGELPARHSGVPPPVEELENPFAWEGQTYALCQGITNVQCANNQCFPMAVSNCFQVLENRGEIVIPHNHVLGLGGDTTLVGRMDDLCGRFITNRAHGTGVWFRAMTDATFAYLEENGLLGQLTHRHQGVGYGGSLLNMLPTGGFSSHGCTTVEDGLTPTWAWMEQRFLDGCAVLAVYRYADVAHAIRIVGVGRTSGRPWILYAHDAEQTHTDPMDTSGLETVFVYPADLDGDGQLNLCTEDQEIVFLQAHCP